MCAYALVCFHYVCVCAAFSLSSAPFIRAFCSIRRLNWILRSEFRCMYWRRRYLTPTPSPLFSIRRWQCRVHLVHFGGVEIKDEVSIFFIDFLGTLRLSLVSGDEGSPVGVAPCGVARWPRGRCSGFLLARPLSVSIGAIFRIFGSVKCLMLESIWPRDKNAVHHHRLLHSTNLGYTRVERCDVYRVDWKKVDFPS